MMLNAAQHVSAVLTSKQSRRREAGFQTLFYSQEHLNEADLRVIERQVQGGPPNGIAKWQSYKLDSDRHVISRIVSIPEPDEVGRRGRFFAKSLIFNTKGVVQFDDSIFDLLRCPSLHLTLDQLLRSENAQTGNAAKIRVEASREWVAEAENLAGAWPGDQLNTLFMLMAQSAQLTAQGQFVTFVGDEAQILNALKVAFLLSPSETRRFCSFDTGVARDPDLNFWGQGRVQAHDAVCVIDAAARRVITSERMKPRSESSSLMQLSPVLRASVAENLNRRSRLQKFFNLSYRAFVAESVYQTALRKPELLTPTDVQQVLPLGQIHSGLGLLLAIRMGDDAKRLELLGSMESDSYQVRISEMRNAPGFKPWHVFSPVFIPAWLALFPSGYFLDDLTKALITVAQHGSAKDRILLTALAEHLSPDQRQALSSWLQTSSLDLTGLQIALSKPVNSQEKSIEESNSLWRRVLNPFGR